ncbi:hypothetical protein T08_1593 [Trichinella sp. T8]|nr:hypothetical protein T08_1593 [Trichinella sp. T8]
MKDKLTVCDNLMAFSTIKANGNLHKRYDIFPCLRLGINNSKLQFICPNILLKLLINKLITKKCRSLFISSSEWSRHYVINFNQDHLRCSPFPHMHNKMSTKLETLNLTSTKSTTFVLKIICHHCFRRNDTDDWRIPLKFGSKWRIDAVAILKFVCGLLVNERRSYGNFRMREEVRETIRESRLTANFETARGIDCGVA